MAYKFQMGTGILSGALEPALDAKYDLGSSGMEWKDLYIDGTANIDSLVADTADINGGNIDGTVIGATSVAAGSFAAVVGTTGTYSGILKTDDATEATSTTDGSLQTDGGLSVVKSAVIGDDLDLLSNAAVFKVGSDQPFTMTHANANNTLLVSQDHRLAFGDAADYILGDGTDLKIVCSGLVDINGDTSVTGTGTFSGVLKTDSTTEATSTTDGSLQTDGGLSVAKSAVIGDDLDLLSDQAIINIGSTSKFTLTDQAANNCVMATANHRLAFGNAGEYITGDGTDLSVVSSADVKFTAGAVKPASNDGSALGSATAQWSDLFLAEGGVINFDNGDMTMTQAGNVLTVAGGTLTATFTNSLSKAANSGLAMTTYDGAAAVSDLAVDLNSLGAATVAVAADSIAIIDATDDSTKKESIVDLVAGIAGTGLSASNGQLSVSSASDPAAVGDAAATLTEAFNYANATITANRVWTLPASAGLSAGDVVSVKAAVINTGLHIAITPAGSQTIDGVAEAILLESSYGAVQLKYVAADTWMIF